LLVFTAVEALLKEYWDFVSTVKQQGTIAENWHQLARTRALHIALTIIAGQTVN
jgi:hypothetical protein